ncbi:MAG: conjugal transfer protein [Pseudomonadota bacterium]
MKILLSLFIGLVFISGNAAAADPCASLLCLVGKLSGQGGGSSCNQPIADYFNLVGFKNGHFSDGRTQGLRDNYLNGCNSSGNEQYKSQISNNYGRLRNTPF